MQIMLTGRHIEITTALKRYAEKKIGRLKRYFDNLIEAHVILSVEKHRHIAEVTIKAKRNTIHCKEESNDMYASLDQAVEKLERQIKKYKEKLIAHKVASPPKNIKMRMNIISSEGIPGEEDYRIIKSRKFAVKPMSVDEAVVLINLSKDEFLVFSNSRTGKVNVVYKRKDGNYGLIEPEF